MTVVHKFVVRLKVMDLFSSENIETVDANKFLIKRDDCIEFENEPAVKERKPKFKTVTERDEYLKKFKKQ